MADCLFFAWLKGFEIEKKRNSELDAILILFDDSAQMEFLIDYYDNL